MKFEDRLLFHPMQTGRVIYQLHNDGGGYTISAGAVQGLVEDAHFDIYMSSDFLEDDTPVVQMIAKTVGPFSVELGFAPSSATSTIRISDSSPYFAVQTPIGRSSGLHLHVPTLEGLVPVMSAVAKHRANDDPAHPEIILCDETQANLSTRLTSSGDIEYLMNDPLIRTHGLTKLLATTPAQVDDVYPVLAAASRFFWHLHRAPTMSQTLDNQPIRVEMYKVKAQGLGSRRTQEYKEFGEDLVHSGIVDIEADRRAHGFIVKNQSDRPLYLWAFYFDCSNLSIGES